MRRERPNNSPVSAAIADAEAILPETPAVEGGLDPRWQAIIEVGQFIEEEPEAVWAFSRKWGECEDDDLRMAVATVLLEHLLEYHFDLIFPRVRATAQQNPLFAWTFAHCWKFGQSELPANAQQFDALRREVMGGHAGDHHQPRKRP